MAEQKEIGFAVACKKFFGLMPEQNMQGFVAEIKKLTPEDKKEMAPQLAAELGMPVKA